MIIIDHLRENICYPSKDKSNGGLSEILPSFRETEMTF